MLLPTEHYYPLTVLHPIPYSVRDDSSDPVVVVIENLQVSLPIPSHPFPSLGSQFRDSDLNYA